MKQITRNDGVMNMDIVVKDNDVCILTLSESALAVFDAEDARGGIRGHADSIDKRYVSLLYHSTDESVKGGYATCQC